MAPLWRSRFIDDEAKLCCVNWKSLGSEYLNSPACVIQSKQGNGISQSHSLARSHTRIHSGTGLPYTWAGLKPTYGTQRIVSTKKRKRVPYSTKHMKKLTVFFASRTPTVDFSFFARASDMMHLDGAPTSILPLHKKNRHHGQKQYPPNATGNSGGVAIGDAVQVTADGSTYFKKCGKVTHQ